MVSRVAIAMIFGALALCGQAARFEVASVKKAAGDGNPGDIAHNTDASPGHFAMRNVSLRYCLEWAYSLQDYEIEGPEWIKNDERYDIIARAAGPASDEEMRPMLQTLLTERFQMKVHREKRPLQAYVLLPGKGAAKVKESAADSQPALIPGKSGEVTFRHFGISRLTFLLTRRMGRPVLDQTGLKGIFDYTLNLSGLSEFSGPPAAEPNGVTIFAAIQEELGLRLEARKQEPIDLFIVDAANKVPIAN
jgi:uncharacterized protein (TIGR03435 family)